mmetsp:Transcript_74857/g.136815  ORF Transcript_74857/g.136815 Transcript_74857/m.136815 type:complete len:89 (+) Transcript_74857:461-727(+)
MCQFVQGGTSVGTAHGVCQLPHREPVGACRAAIKSPVQLASRCLELQGAPGDMANGDQAAVRAAGEDPFPKTPPPWHAPPALPPFVQS